jgi:anaerobic magnesium-protoporphyrin IX monomethyl ester cyclase
MTFTIRDVIQTVECVREVAPRTKVVLGGPHVHLFPEETIRLHAVDYLVLGEGEVAFERLLEAMDDPGAIKEIPGIVFLEGDEIVSTGSPVPISDLDALPFPARDLTPFREYDSILSSGGVVTTIFTSRGCPFRCRFCDRPHLGKQFRARSAENVLDELEECFASVGH